MVKIIACVFSYRNPDELEKALGCLIKMTTPAGTLLDLCVIDNTENTGEAERIEQLCANTGVRYLPMERNVGVAGAAYRARQIALEEDYDYLWLWDQDSQAPSDCLGVLLQSFMKDERDSALPIGMVGPKLIDPDEVESFFVFCNEPYKLASMHNHAYPTDWINAGEVQTNYLISSGSLIRREVLEKIDGPDSDLFMDTVDFSYCSQLVVAGYRILLNANTCLHHRVGHPRKHVFFSKTLYGRNYAPFRYYYQARNDLLTARHGGLRPWLQMAWVGFIRGIRILITESAVVPKLRAHYTGWFHGLMGKRGKSHAPWMAD